MRRRPSLHTRRRRARRRAELLNLVAGLGLMVLAAAGLAAEVYATVNHLGGF